MVVVALTGYVSVADILAKILGAWVSKAAEDRIKIGDT
jgi:hypothetical protein